MRKRNLITPALLCGTAVLALASLASAGGSAQAKTVKLSAPLGTAQEVPAPKGAPMGAGGQFAATVTGKTLKWTMTFGHLSGPVLSAHIHAGAKGKSGPVVIALCGPCKSPASGTIAAGGITAAQLAAMAAGKDYVNVHTKKNPKGELRGQLGT